MAQRFLSVTSDNLVYKRHYCEGLGTGKNRTFISLLFFAVFSHRARFGGTTLGVSVVAQYGGFYAVSMAFVKGFPVEWMGWIRKDWLASLLYWAIVYTECIGNSYSLLSITSTNNPKQLLFYESWKFIEKFLTSYKSRDGLEKYLNFFCGNF